MSLKEKIQTLSYSLFEASPLTKKMELLPIGFREYVQWTRKPLHRYFVFSAKLSSQFTLKQGEFGSTNMDLNEVQSSHGNAMSPPAYSPKSAGASRGRGKWNFLEQRQAAIVSKAKPEKGASVPPKQPVF
mmetsp:Transcript_10636/g.16221  ORF Transcript_10636/g.16221 Transcript_10636/m.16221 type:complete len:130 (+) Transcript_10636:1200-1589(+)